MLMLLILWWSRVWKNLVILTCRWCLHMDLFPQIQTNKSAVILVLSDFFMQSNLAFNGEHFFFLNGCPFRQLVILVTAKMCNFVENVKMTSQSEMETRGNQHISISPLFFCDSLFTQFIITSAEKNTEMY